MGTAKVDQRKVWLHLHQLAQAPVRGARCVLSLIETGYSERQTKSKGRAGSLLPLIFGVGGVTSKHLGPAQLFFCQNAATASQDRSWISGTGDAGGEPEGRFDARSSLLLKATACLAST